MGTRKHFYITTPVGLQLQGLALNNDGRQHRSKKEGDTGCVTDSVICCFWILVTVTDPSGKTTPTQYIPCYRSQKNHGHSDSTQHDVRSESSRLIIQSKERKCSVHASSKTRL